jgi:hypothetical protein
MSLPPSFGFGPIILRKKSQFRKHMVHDCECVVCIVKPRNFFVNAPSYLKIAQNKQFLGFIKNGFAVSEHIFGHRFLIIELHVIINLHFIYAIIRFINIYKNFGRGLSKAFCRQLHHKLRKTLYSPKVISNMQQEVRAIF